MRVGLFVRGDATALLVETGRVCGSESCCVVGPTREVAGLVSLWLPCSLKRSSVSPCCRDFWVETS